MQLKRKQQRSLVVCHFSVKMKQSRFQRGLRWPAADPGNVLKLRIPMKSVLLLLLQRCLLDWLK